MRSLIARADQGGLGTMTYNLAREVKFDRIAVIVMPEPRGKQDSRKYAALGVEVKAWKWPNLRGMADWVTEADVVYTAEYPYDYGLWPIAEHAGCRVVLHAMPELLKPEWDLSTVEVWYPTPWLAPADAKIVPVPCSPPAEWTQRTEAKRFGVVGGEAMADRNGTMMALGALDYLPFAVEVHAWHCEYHRRSNVRHYGHLDDPSEFYDNIDVLVMPRRFGGLSLLVNEAAERGIPSIHLDRIPDNTFPGWAVPVDERTFHKMAGGRVEVSATDPRHVSWRMNVLHGSPSEVAAESYGARCWAEAHSWRNLRAVYEKHL